jgi:hypothetical protein
LGEVESRDLTDVLLDWKEPMMDGNLPRFQEIGSGWPMTESTSGSGFGLEHTSGRVDEGVSRGEPWETETAQGNKDTRRGAVGNGPTDRRVLE